MRHSSPRFMGSKRTLMAHLLYHLFDHHRQARRSTQAMNEIKWQNFHRSTYNQSRIVRMITLTECILCLLTTLTLLTHRPSGQSCLQSLAGTVVCPLCHQLTWLPFDVSLAVDLGVRGLCRSFWTNVSPRCKSRFKVKTAQLVSSLGFLNSEQNPHHRVAIASTDKGSTGEY